MSPTARSRWALVVVALLAALAGYLADRRPHTSVPTPIPARADPAPLLATRFLDENGQTQTLGERFPHRVLVINFWATWCPPCREEMPMLARLSKAFVENNVQFVGISVDEPERVAAYRRTPGSPYPLWLASPETVGLTSGLGNSAQGLPFTVIIDPAGHLADARLGQYSEADLTTSIHAVLRKQ